MPENYRYSSASLCYFSFDFRVLRLLFSADAVLFPPKSHDHELKTDSDSNPTPKLSSNTLLRHTPKHCDDSMLETIPAGSLVLAAN